MASLFKRLRRSAECYRAERHEFVDCLRGVQFFVDAGRADTPAEYLVVMAGVRAELTLFGPIVPRWHGAATDAPPHLLTWH